MYTPGAMLATRMNGRVLLPEHGFPLRTVVPGFIGARSVKWLGRITLSDRPSPNYFVARSYKVIAEDTPAALAAATPIYEQTLNSMICSPAEGAAVSGDRLTVKGFAMAAGHAGRSIKLVEVSLRSRPTTASRGNRPSSRRLSASSAGSFGRPMSH